MEVLGNLLKYIVSGGPEAIIAILVTLLVICVFVLRLSYNAIKLKDALLEKKADHNEKLLDNYYEGNKRIAEALNSVQIALIELRAKL